ncbi:MAG: hypothetical protein KA116_07200 [Proteobacteria bacterium]|nr:hypothetical protein [Pseudomonadota bacterium]
MPNLNFPHSFLMEPILKELDKISALDVAELFLSPFVHPKLLCEATTEAGPANWIVNRSDIYDPTLEALLKHPLNEISSRAAEKLKMRRSTLTLLTPPQVPPSFEEIPEHSVEDLLGHPLCPFEAMLFFSYSTNEDHRASSALSLCRRVLEHPPDWRINPKAKEKLAERFGEMLLNDSSFTVRSYAARVPILEASTLEKSASQESHLNTLARVLQNPARSQDCLALVANDQISHESQISRILTLDSQLPLDLRRSLETKLNDPLSFHINNWHLRQ